MSADSGSPPTKAATEGRGERDEEERGKRESSEETTSAACSATSLVGARISARGADTETEFAAFAAAVAVSTAGTPNAAVLPVPDLARTRRSAPERASGMAKAFGEREFFRGRG